MKQVDIAKLRQLTDAAIQRGKDEAARKLAHITAENERKARQDKLFAANVLAQVPDKCEKEAERERSHAVVMGLKWGRDHDGYNGNTMTYTQLKGPGAIVWNNLQEQGLNPTLEYWHDGVGIEGGFNIVVHW